MVTQPSGVAGIPAQGVGSLQSLLRRLEAATSRLEDIAMTQASAGGMQHLSGASAVAAAPAAAAPAQAAAVAAPPQVPKEQPKLAPQVEAFDALIDGPLTAYISLSKELGGLIADQAQHVANGFIAQKDFIQLASACTKLPTSSPQYSTIIGPTQSALMAVIETKEKNRGSKEMNQLTVVSEGIPALGWVTLDNLPGPYVNEFKDSAMFWVNRVIKEHKESNPKQVEWARSFVALLEELRKYIMAHHTTGLTWNPKGGDATTYKPAEVSSGGGPPPPPPPPPPPGPPAPPPPPPPAAAASPSAPAPAPAAGDMSNVFASLNQGEGITKSLRKVDQSEMTHKNPSLRAGGAVPTESAPGNAKGPQKPPKPTQMQKRPPKTELDGNKWNIENHENNSAIILDQTEINHIVNVFNVKSSIIQIKGKVNAVNLVNCPKTSVLIDSAVSALSVSNSPSFTIQILGKVPTVLIDGCDGGQVYLSKTSLETEIVSAKSSALNISLPVEGDEEGVFEEKAVPEQFKTVVVNGKLVTSVVEHSG
ncbi:adenylate cyclase-binding protein [Sporobolomyces koalae]|uniref:adenylate cyclase-binding protein n=1 Tax=Sporobolomyces koalae TaxID=500713 RepID=UPI00317579D4